jgi:hypothetical protein
MLVTAINACMEYVTVSLEAVSRTDRWGGGAVLTRVALLFESLPYHMYDLCQSVSEFKLREDKAI